MHHNGCQGVLRERHYDGMWYRRVGAWLHYQKWLHEVDLAYHILGLRHATYPKGLATARRSTTQHGLLPATSQTGMYH